jgi:transglycosylase-like protein
MIHDHARARKTLIGPLSLGILVALALAMMIAMAATGPAGATTGGASTGGTVTVTSTSSSGDRYDRLWRSFSRKNRRWAKRTSACESGGNPSIHGYGGTYHGAFQFALGTWRTAPRSPGGDPHTYRWRVQAVVAIALKKRDGAGAWPVCG